MIEYALRSTFNNYFGTTNEHYVEWYAYDKYNDREIDVDNYNKFNLWVYRIDDEIYIEDSEEFRKAIFWSKLAC